MYTLAPGGKFRDLVNFDQWKLIFPMRHLISNTENYNLKTCILLWFNQSFAFIHPKYVSNPDIKFRYMDI